MEHSIFLKNIVNNLNKELLIIVPYKTNMENYILDLESEIQKEYKVDIHRSTISYIDYTLWKQKEEQFIGPQFVLIDPKCYEKEIKRRDEVLKEIFNLLCKIRNWQ